MKTEKAFNIYRSSAGSGKTYSLVIEYLRLALSSSNSSNYKYILAITFTNKAAEEMKTRVLEALKLINVKDDSKARDLRKTLSDLIGIEEETVVLRANAMLKNMLHNYSDIAISTIDKFVHKLVRSFARDLMLSHDFEVDTDTEVYLEEAVSKLLQKVGTDAYITQILIRYLNEQVDNNTSWDLKRALIATGKKIVRSEGLAALEALSSFNEDQFEELGKQIDKFQNNYDKMHAAFGKEALQIIQQSGLTIDDFNRKGTGIYGFFEKLSKGDSAAAANSFVTKTIESQNFGTKEHTVANAVAQPLTEIYHKVVAFREQSQSTYIVCSELKKRLRQLSLLNEIHKSLMEVKEDNNLIFIDDFHQKIAEVVKDEPSPFIYERIGSRYKYILIDEFQDTSTLQWHNFLPLVEHALSENNFVLLVGDGKQAIYRFRGGEVEQFDRLPEIIDENNQPISPEKSEVLKKHYQQKNLPSNYRSYGKVVEFNNQLFESLKNQLPQEFQNIYNDQSQIITKEKDAGLVTVHFIDPKLENEGEKKPKSKPKSDINDEKLALLSKNISECLTDGYEYNNLCIIVRDKKSSTLIANYLSKLEIPIISNESLLVGVHPSVTFLCSALKYLSNTNNLEYALQFLIQLTKNLSPNDVAEVFNSYTRKAGRELKVVDIQKFMKDHNFAWFERSLLSLPLYDLVESLLRIFKTINTSSAHLSFFKQSVLNFAAKNGNDIHAFIRWWDEKGIKLSISTPEESKAIRIMTIHKAKGLQFPVVLLPFCDWDFKSTYNEHWVKTPESIQQTLSCPTPPVMISSLSSGVESSELWPAAKLENDRILLDNLNLLYVATTRAEERLYLTTLLDESKDEPKNVSHWISGYARQQNWNGTFYQSGERHSPKTKKPENTELMVNEIALNDGWQNRLKINMDAGDLIEGDIKESHRSRGKIMHLLMAELSNKEDLNTLVKQLEDRGILPKEDSDLIAKKINDLLLIPASEEWFKTEGNLVLNERAILSPNGQTYRPDKIILNDKNALIVDFKTGNPSSTHQNQIKQYGSLLQTMGYNCRLQLAYMDKPEIVNVEMNEQTSLF